MSKTFGPWDASIHALPEQIRKIDRARKAETSPSSTDPSTFTGVFPSSGQNPYYTSLDSCTCPNFRINKLFPCKHMYRLAMELGLFDGSFEHGANKNTYPPIQDVVATLENYSDDVQLLILNVIRGIIAKNPLVECYVTENVLPILSFPYLQFKPSSISSIMADYRKTDIVAILDQQNALPEQKMLKADLIRYCETLGDKLRDVLPKKYEVTAMPTFSKAIHKLEDYLSRKYEWTKDGLFAELWFPARSKPASELVGGFFSGGSELYFFPNDEVTAMLTQYCVNRCLNGFVPLTSDPRKMEQEADESIT